MKRCASGASMALVTTMDLALHSDAGRMTLVFLNNCDIWILSE
jgi:hypothetical protein